MEMDQESHREGQGARSTSADEMISEPFPDWLNEMESRRVKDYTDVNEAEKRIMIMWNIHITKCNVTGDVHIPLACRRFVELHGGEIERRHLYRNFCLHIANLHDFGLLSVEDVHGIIEMYHSQRKAAAKAKPMEVSGDDEEVKTPRKIKRRSSKVAATSACERSPLKKLTINLERTEAFVATSVQQTVPHREISPPSSKIEVNPVTLSPPDTKYPKKPKREKFPSYD